MIRSTATPCPVARNAIIDDTFADETSQLDYTTAFKASFRNVRAKRLPARREAIDFAIHEDSEEASRPAVKAVSRNSSTGPSLLQNARRVATAPTRRAVQGQFASQAVEARSVEDRHVAKICKFVPRDDGVKIEKCGEVRPLPNGQKEKFKVVQDQSNAMDQRSARRRTIYIPSDDTTQPTMWMGIFSPVEGDLNTVGHENNPEFTGIAAQMAEKRKRRAPRIQNKPKRGPLKTSSNAQGTAGSSEDQVGALTGKENLPPKYILTSKSTPNPGVRKPQTTIQERDEERRNFLSNARLQKTKRRHSGDSLAVATIYEVGSSTNTNTSQERTAWNAGPRAIVQSPQQRRITRRERCSASPVHVKVESPRATAPVPFVRTVLESALHNAQNISLVEHIVKPQMYEENWLEHQETAIVQILNTVFDSAQARNTVDDQSVRSALIAKYNGPESALIYSKIQSASMYGALSLTGETMLQIQNLTRDVGRKQKFLRFWLDNYNNELLKIALETVTGRQCSLQPLKPPSPRKSSAASRRQSLAQFIESFFLRHEEAHFKLPGTGSSTNDLGSKTILKSLMLAKALDMLKELACVEVCLFRRQALFKTSTAAVRELMTMLNPAVGDPIRALRQLGYTVHYEQSIISEITYRVENLAVDFRDGVYLTKLAEIMLSGSANNARWQSQPDTSTAYTRSDGVGISSEDLKLPCVSRASKLWNTKIALDAFHNTEIMRKVIQNITPEHLVDGHKEETVNLLWTLVCQFGLSKLLDQNDLRREIRRLNGIGDDLVTPDLEPSNGAQTLCERLLVQWATAAALARKTSICNFSTSFSDGKAFGAILDEYEPYLFPGMGPSSSIPLHERLTRIGCSKPFSEIFLAHNKHVFTTEFVLAALALLCSLVLSPSRTCRSAICVQRQWRKYWQTIQCRRQDEKRELARDCAAQVESRKAVSSQTVDGHPAAIQVVGRQNTRVDRHGWFGS